MILTLLPNDVGRDFVIGDIHGCYKELTLLFDTVNFDSLKDRLIAVGDLIDRGRESIQCAMLTHFSWFHSVRGNHENNILNWFYADTLESKKNLEKSWRLQGGDWFFSLKDQQKEDLYHSVLGLPLVILINSKTYTYCIIHGEIPPEFDHLNEFLYHLLNGSESVVSACLMGRRRRQIKSPKSISGVDYILSGHTPCSIKNVQRGNSICLDFGAGYTGYNGYLGMLELESNKLILNNNGEIIYPDYNFE